MKPPPTPLRTRAFDLLCADIADPTARGFDRVDALREVRRVVREKR